MISNTVYIGGTRYKWIDQFAKSDEWKAIESYANSNSLALPTDTTAFDQLIKDLKSAGIWQKLDVFYVFAGDGSNGFKLINWIDTSRHYADAYGGLTWDLDGIKGNSSNAYIDTNYTSSVDGINRQLGSASIFGVMSKSGNRVWGSYHPTNIRDMLNGNYTPEKQVDGNFTSVSLPVVVGFVGIIRNGASSGFFVSKDSNTALSGGSNSLTIYRNTLLAGRSNLYGNAGLSCWATGGSLTYAETQTFRTIYNNFLTDIGLTPIA